jgi:hypothetical protein
MTLAIILAVLLVVVLALRAWDDLEPPSTPNSPALAR